MRICSPKEKKRPDDRGIVSENGKIVPLQHISNNARNGISLGMKPWRLSRHLLNLA